MTDIIELMRTKFVEYIKEVADAPFVVSKILSQEGLVEEHNDWGFGNLEQLVQSAQNLGFMGINDFENAKEVFPKWTSKTGKALSLTGKLVMTKSQLAMISHSPLGIKLGFQGVISMQMADFKRQLEGMVCSGDASRYFATGDPLAKTAGNSVVLGALNGVNGTGATTYAAGTGADNNCKDYGDFLDSMVTVMTDASQYVDITRGHVIMDPTTYGNLGKHRSAMDIPELKTIKEQYPGFTFHSTPHFLQNNDTTSNYFIVMFPWDNNGYPLIKLHKMKELEVEAVCGGALTPDLNYQWAIGGKQGVLVLDQHAVYRNAADLAFV